MANYVEVYVKCPCGHLLEKRRVLENSKSRTNWTKRCQSCKQNVRCALDGVHIFTSYQK